MILIPGIAGGFIQTSTDTLRSAASNVGQFLTATVAIQGVTLGADFLLQKAAKNIVDNGDIQEDASQLIANIIQEEGEMLALIHATDELRGAGGHLKELKGLLYQKIDGVMAKYQNRFHEDKVEFAVGTAGKVIGHFMDGQGWPGLRGIVETGTRVTMGTVKNAQALGKIHKGTREAIREVGAKALTSGELMSLQLNRESN